MCRDGNPGTLAYETDYEYDGFDEVVQIDQWGGVKGSSSPGDRKRLFAYDSIGREIAENIPEFQSSVSPASRTCSGAPSGSVWTMCKTLDGNGNVVLKAEMREVDLADIPLKELRDALSGQVQQLLSRGEPDSLEVHSRTETNCEWPSKRFVSESLDLPLLLRCPLILELVLI